MQDIKQDISKITYNKQLVVEEQLCSFLLFYSKQLLCLDMIVINGK